MTLDFAPIPNTNVTNTVASNITQFGGNSIITGNGTGGAKGMKGTVASAGFGNGVATVVSKLLIQCAPDLAIFGEKDFQQLKVIEQIAADLDLPVKIVAAPIVREPDGLALSSRNAYLSAEERAAAPMLFRVLTDCAQRIAGRAHIARTLDEGGIAIQRAGFQLDYLELRNAKTLVKVETADAGPLRLLVAARIGQTRLIDNVGV